MAEPSAAPKVKIEGQFEDSPVGWSRYWQREFSAAREEGGEDWPGIKDWQERANKVVKRYRASKKGSKKGNDARIAIFPANVQTQRAILVGQVPKCEVTRRHDDPDDDVARVAADMMERILNSRLEEESKGLAFVLSRCTEDRLLPGMCGSRVQFSAEFVQDPGKPAITAPCQECGGSGEAPQAVPEMMAINLMAPPRYDSCAGCQGTGHVEQAPAVPPSEKPANETADAVYVNWRDKLWSPCRTPDEIRWRAYGADMSRKQLREMFEEGGDSRIPTLGKSKKDGDSKKETPWTRVRVWEVWSKEHQRLFWVVEGFLQTLTNKQNPEGTDPLGLDDFFPEPVEMMANATTDAWLATPDYEYAEDLYNEADDLTARIRGVVRAIKVAGVYDKSNSAVRRLLDEACELELIPVSDWSTFLGTKGGLAGAIQLLPIKEMVETVQVLVAQRNEVIQGIYQITGLGDIIRGQQQQSETATTSAIKARFASVRLQDLQKEVARYATDLQRLRKEVVAKHWSIPTIIERSCILRGEEGKTPEGMQRVMKAAQLIKDKHLDFCVAVKPEQVSLQDWAQLKQQRSEVLQGLGAYHASMMPFLQMCMQGGPDVLKAGIQLVFRNAQWLVAGMPGASGVESAYDSFVQQIEKAAAAAAQQPPAPPQPDPKVLAEQAKLQGTQVKAQAEQTKAKLGVVTAVVDAHAHAAKTQMEMQRSQQDHHFGMQRAENDERKAALEAVNGALGPPQGGV